MAGAWTWLRNGSEAFPAMLGAIEAARESVHLEMYIYSPDSLGERFRRALLGARRRGARVRVLVDGLGSMDLPAVWWDELRAAGGEVRVFNPLALRRLGIRDHRKLLVCDGREAFIGGFNISSEYEGDGVSAGWLDLGLKLEGPLVGALETGFNEMFEGADFRIKGFMRLHRSRSRKAAPAPREHLFLSGPGWGRSPLKSALRADFSRARSLDIMTAYFLPSLRQRRQLMRLARHGGRVRLLLSAKSDVAVSQLAARSLYRRLLKAGVEIYEYEPQVLHAKLIIADNAVYAGSANLDHRSLNINYELMARIEDPAAAAQARGIFQESLLHSQRITLEAWVRSGTVWRRLKEHWAYFLLARIDPFLARRQWRARAD